MAGNSDEGIRLKCFDKAKAGFDLIERRPDFSIKTLKQIHGKTGYQVSSKCNELKEGDWLWTKEVAVRIGVLVADCSAILVSGHNTSYDNLVVAIHAGWRGTAAGIIEEAVRSLHLLEWTAWISPSICQNHFEVGAEVIEALGHEAKFFSRAGDPGKFFLDLKGLQASKLKKLGGQVFASSLCNYCQSDFVSYRKAKGLLEARHIGWIELD